MEKVGVIAHLSYKDTYSRKHITTLRDYYGDVCRAFGISDMVLVNQGSAKLIYSNVVDSFDEAMSRFTNYKPIYLMPSGLVRLGSFKHPDAEAVYIIGPDHYCSYKIPDGAVTVTIGRDNLWGHQALAITLWDRAVKEKTWLSL